MEYLDSTWNFFFQKFALTNVHHFDLSEKQDSCGNHPEEAEYDEYHDQIGWDRNESRGYWVIVDEVL